jgi:hypothetical protein
VLRCSDDAFDAGKELVLIPGIQEDPAVGGRGMSHQRGGALGVLQVCGDQVTRNQVVVGGDGDDGFAGHVLRPQHEGVPQKLAAKGLRQLF